MRAYVKNPARCLPALTALLAWMLAGGAAAQAPVADGRDFTFLYQTSTLPRGEHEYEQWVTWQTDKESDAAYDRFEFRQEFEHGVSDRLQFAFYLATWRYTRSGAGSNTVVHDTAVELVYKLSDPGSTALGAALYGEVKLDSELFELEGKLLLEKPLGPWTLAYNAVVEAEWEEEDWVEDNGELAQLLGFSRRLSPRLSLGGELLHEIAVPDWQETADGVLWVGPNLALRGRGWWTTVTSLFQLSGEEDEPGLQVRALIGKPF